MNCENALELMNRELDEALTESESAALRTHLDACPDCRETWRQLHELDALLQDGELEPPAALHDGVMQAIRQEQKKPCRAWVPAAAIAAAAALVLLAGRAGLIALPGFEQTDVISVNIGPAVEQIFTQTGAEAPDEAAAQQAATLSAETGLDVLLVWDRGVPSELESTAYEAKQNGARLYRPAGADDSGRISRGGLFPRRRILRSAGKRSGICTGAAVTEASAPEIPICIMEAL